MKRTQLEPDSNDTRTVIEHLSNANRTTGRYTGGQVAANCGCSEGAIRKWLVKLTQAVPYDWCKVSGRYTELAHVLMSDYAIRVSQGELPSEAWILEIRNWFEAQPRQVEVLPADSAIALATNDQTATALDGYLSQLGSEIVEATHRVDALCDDLEADDLAMFQAEVEAARHRGQKKAVILYGAEKQAQNEAVQALRQREIERKQQGG